MFNKKFLLRTLFLLAGIVITTVALGATPGLSQIRDASYFYGSSGTISANGARNILINLFFVAASLLFVVAIIVAFLAAIRILSSNNSEEDFSKWSKTLIWSIAGLFVVAISYSVLEALNSNVLNSAAGFNGGTIYYATMRIVYPLLNFLRYIAAICFFMVIIFSFYRMVIGGGNEEYFEAGKKTFIIATIGFIIMILAEPIVRMVYGGDNCSGLPLFGMPTGCVRRSFDPSTFLDLVIKIIVFLNGFIALITIIMIMYAGFLILTGSGDEEKSEKAKKIIMYIIIGIIIILFSYVAYRALLLWV